MREVDAQHAIEGVQQGSLERFLQQRVMMEAIDRRDLEPAGKQDPAQFVEAERRHVGRIPQVRRRVERVRRRERDDAAIDQQWPGREKAFRPLEGQRALDVGCGAGLLTEPLARLGASVTGLDAAPENIAAALSHAESQGLTIDYRATPVEEMAEGGFDLVTSMEVIEHVVDPATFVRALASKVSPDGLLILSTPNRTPLSRIAMITVGESIGGIPKGTHDWGKFLTPEELTALLDAAGMAQ